MEPKFFICSGSGSGVYSVFFSLWLRLRLRLLLRLPLQMNISAAGPEKCPDGSSSDSKEIVGTGFDSGSCSVHLEIDLSGLTLPGRGGGGVTVGATPPDGISATAQNAL